MSRLKDLERIEVALRLAEKVLEPFTPGAIEAEQKEGGDPVTEADRRINETLYSALPRAGEGWLSEETVDDLERLDRSRVWVVDPLDGTREFVEGLPEWSISIGLVEEGQPVAGGILNPATGQLVLGALGHGVTLNGEPASLTDAKTLEGTTVLASRSEVRRGEWDDFKNRGFEVRPCGSVAYKLAMVAAGQVDATWTLVPKHEWDVAAGVALVRAAAGRIEVLEEPYRGFNRRVPRLAGLLAYPPALAESIHGLLRAVRH